MYSYKLKYYPNDIQGKGDGFNFVEHPIKPLVEGDFIREVQGYRIRVKFSGKITLINNAKLGVNDYDLFKHIESLNAGKTVYIDIYENTKIFTGYFYPFNCEVNDDNCTVTISELMPQDEYTIFDEIGDVSYNIINEVQPYQIPVNINNPVRMEYYVCQRTFDAVMNTFDPQCIKPDVSNTSNPNYQNLIWKGLPDDPYTLPTDYHPSYEPTKLFSSWYMYNDMNTFPYGTIGDSYRNLLVSLSRIVKNEVTINNIISGWVYNITVKTTWALEIQYTAKNPQTLQPQTPTGGGWNLLEDDILIHGVYHSKWGRIPFYNRQIVDGDQSTYEYTTSNYVCSSYYEYSLINPYNGGLYNSTLTYRGRSLQHIIQMFALKAGVLQAYRFSILFCTD